MTLEPGKATSFMLQLKNVREVVREDNDDPTGVVVTQVIDDQKFIVYASTSKLCQLKNINISPGGYS